MWRVLPVCALLLGLLLGMAPRPVSAAGPEPSSPQDAVIAVREADLSALLSSRLLGEHSFVTAADLGLDQAALASLREVSAAAVLPRTATGRDRSPQQVVVPVPGVPPAFVPVPTVRLAVPVFVFRPIRVAVRPVLPPPVFRGPAILVLPPPPPLLPPLPPVLAPPPPPLAAPYGARPPARFPDVPIIPEADTFVLVGGGLVLLGALGALRLRRRRE
jgi:hypothetical protein